MKIIVIDDDPTGSQTVHDCLLLLKWDYETLFAGLKHNSNIIFILSNTRSLPEIEVKERLNQICNNLKKVISHKDFNENDFLYVSRGDSTLRGHNYLEPHCIDQLLGPFDATFHIPAFLEGNRVTRNGNHYVNNILAHKTIFAKDKIFGYSTSNIKQLIFQKSNHKLGLDYIQNLYLSDLNNLEVNKNNVVYKSLLNLKNNSHVIVDINNYAQLNKFSYVIKTLIGKKKFLFRTSASFLSSVSNIEKNNKNKESYSQLRRKDNKNNFMQGLFVIGSYVDITTKQVNQILKIRSLEAIKLDVFNFYKILYSKDNQQKMSFLKRLVVNDIRTCLRGSKTPVLFTSRELMTFENQNEQIRFFKELSLFISEIVSEVKYEIGYLISKGGLTSNTLLSHCYGLNYVYLEGQLEDGISLVTFEISETKALLPFVTFPGNIGDEQSLVNIWRILENKDL